MSLFDPLTGTNFGAIPRYTIYPKTHYVTPRERILEAIEKIKLELQARREYLLANNRLVEEQRLTQRTQFDIEMMNELGYCRGLKITHVIYQGEMRGSHHQRYLIIFQVMVC